MRDVSFSTTGPIRVATPAALRAAALACLTAATTALAPAPAAACGGLFCNAQTPVNQTAERILFVDHGDGTTTAAIEIMYQGDAERFAWVLPLGDIADPDNDIRVSSVQALDRLQQATNPVYRMTRRTEGECKPYDWESDAQPGFANGSGGTTGARGTADAGVNEGGVVVEASGSVGPFDYEFISVLPETDDPAEVAVQWLDDNGYDLAIGDELLRPYLESGMKLLAVRLTKGNDVGSIRPLMITYQGSKPSIPIRPTAVAAQDDMGVMVFLGAAAQAIPKNYKSLQLNDSLLNWFSFADNYGDVVNAAADEATGQGFVTEYAQASSALRSAVVQQWERDEWQSFQGRAYGTERDMLADATDRFGSWDGFSDAVSAALTGPEGLTPLDVQRCPNCYLDGGRTDVSFDVATFRTALYEQVIRPMFETDELVQAMPYFTRLYTTMSAPDMTLDPVFDVNPELDDVDNNHTAEMVIECNPEVYFDEAPYRVELPSGLVAHGTDQSIWPVTLDSDMKLPAALNIAEVGTSGPRRLVMDNQALIQAALDTVPVGMTGGGDTGRDQGGEGDGKAGVFGCSTMLGRHSDAGAPLALGLLLGLVGLRRRTRHNERNGRNA